MARQKAISLDVSKWQAARPTPTKDPEKFFHFRMIELAIANAKEVNLFGQPTDDALLARDWIARPKPDPHTDPDGFGRSFALCVYVLGSGELERAAEADGLSAEDFVRRWALAQIGNEAMFAAPECVARLANLVANPPADDPEPLFEVERVVPVLDQLSIFQVVA
jgi:hypothetical protein